MSWGSDTVGKVGGYIDERNPWVKKKGNEKEESKQLAEGLFQDTKAISKGLDEADKTFGDAYKQESKKYIDSAKDIVSGYKTKIEDLGNQAQGQAKDARETYTNTILPEQKNAMGMAKANAEQAMTLEQASDPNNPIMKAVRDLYDQQAKAARLQGQQDYGVLSGLGAQAAQGQLGAAGNPMTAGQMGQIYAANQSQAGDAYARAQQRMYDLQQQGLDRGFDQSNLMYQFGQDAQGRFSDTLKDIQNSESKHHQDQGLFREELGNYAGDIFGVDSAFNTDAYNIGLGIPGIDKANAYAGAGREQGATNQKYGVAQQGVTNEAASKQAKDASNAQMTASAMAALATVMASDKKEKKKIGNISDSEIDEFLSAIKPKTFEYKDDSRPGTAPGERIGFMLQDVQGTKLGDAITRKGPQGQLMYDKDNLNGIILAALSRDAKKRVA